MVVVVAKTLEASSPKRKKKEGSKALGLFGIRANIRILRFGN